MSDIDNESLYGSIDNLEELNCDWEQEDDLEEDPDWTSKIKCESCESDPSSSESESD